MQPAHPCSPRSSSRLVSFVLAGIGLALTLTLAVPGCGSAGNSANPPPESAPEPAASTPRVEEPVYETLELGGETLRVELAANDATRSRGLMFRTSIPEDGGMLFVFPYSSMQEFWMGNCYTDMDIIFLDAIGRVTATYSMTAVEPQRPGESVEEYAMRVPRYSSRLPAQFVLEVATGTADRLGISVRDTLDLDLARLTAMAR